MNAIQDYQIETVEIAPAKIKYIEAAQEKIDIEIDQVITLMKKLITLIVVILSLNATAQLDNVKPHTISIESGLWDRGVTGIGYNYNFLKTENSFVSLHASAGVGLGFENQNGLGFENEYYTIAPSINIGGENVFLTVGAQYKYTQHYYYNLSGVLFGGVTPNYEGSGAGGFIGFNIISDGGFNLKGRLSATYLANSGDRMPFMPGAGFSFGYNFGR